MIREEFKVQRPVYYTSQAFQGAKARYPKKEKMAFSLIVASRKLCSYFQAHTIFDMMDQPIQKAMSKPDNSGRMVQWAVAKFTMIDQDLEAEYWMVYADASSAVRVRGVGVILLSLEKDFLKYGVHFSFQQQIM